MASKKWEEAVEELKKKREEILDLEEKENAVIALAKGVVELVLYDKSARVEIPKGQYQIKINDKCNTLRGKEVDISLFKKLLGAASFYAETIEELNNTITIEVSVKQEVSKQKENKADNEADK